MPGCDLSSLFAAAKIGILFGNYNLFAIFTWQKNRNMKKIFPLILCILLCWSVAKAQTGNRTVIISTNAGDMKVKLYDDVPNHVNTFLKRAEAGEYNGTLFTRVIKNFMIQGGAPDSRNAAPGMRCGFGDKAAEIMPEPDTVHFHKKGALAAPRQPENINPAKKSDMSQFFIVHGKVYRPGELDTLELVKNIPIKKKAMEIYYQPVKLELALLKKDNPREYRKRALAINAKVDSVLRATPGHLIFTPEQREAYTTIGGCHHLDGQYVVFGEVTEGLDIIDKIAAQPVDGYDRPKKDIRINKIYTTN